MGTMIDRKAKDERSEIGAKLRGKGKKTKGKGEGLTKKKGFC